MSVVTDYLKNRGLVFEVISHGQAYTSIDEARALGINADEVLKTVALDTPSGHALAVIPGSRRLSTKLVRKAIGDRHISLATEDELEHDFPEFELGALPPLGSLLRTPTYVDPEVMTHETVAFAAGNQKESVKIRTEALFRHESITIVPLTRHASNEDEELLR